MFELLLLFSLHHWGASISLMSVTVGCRWRIVVVVVVVFLLMFAVGFRLICKERRWCIGGLVCCSKWEQYIYILKRKSVVSARFFMLWRWWADLRNWSSWWIWVGGGVRNFCWCSRCQFGKCLLGSVRLQYGILHFQLIYPVHQFGDFLLQYFDFFAYGEHQMRFHKILKFNRRKKRERKEKK